MSTHLSVCLGAVHVVQHLLGPQPLQCMLHRHHTLILQQHNTWARRRRALCHLHMHTLAHACTHAHTTVRLSFSSGPILLCRTVRRQAWTPLEEVLLLPDLHTPVKMQCMYFQSSRTSWDQTRWPPTDTGGNVPGLSQRSASHQPPHHLKPHSPHLYVQREGKEGLNSRRLL